MSTSDFDIRDSASTVEVEGYPSKVCSNKVYSSKTQKNYNTVLPTPLEKDESFSCEDCLSCTYNPNNQCPCSKECFTSFFCNKLSYIMYIVFAVHFILLMCIWFVPIQKNLDDRKFYTDSRCESIGFVRDLSRCCQTGDCSCTQCNLMSVSCNALLTQPLNKSTCCGSSCCAQECCSATCCHSSCDDKGSCRQICVCCAHTCCSSVSQKTCAFTCGTCYNYHLEFRLDYNNQTYYSDMDCGQDDFSCDDNTMGKYAEGKSWECWYDSRDPSHIRFDGVPKLNIAAIVFFSIFSFTCLLSLILWPCLYRYGVCDK